MDPSNSRPPASKAPSPTSPAPQPQSSQPNQPPKPTAEQELATLQRQYSALSQLLWQVIRKAYPEEHAVTVSPDASDPLWEIWFNRAEIDGKPDPSGAMRICAATIPELTEAEKKRVVRTLRGTSRDINEVLRELKLSHPAAYMQEKISDRIKWDGGEWHSVTPATIGETLKNALHLPK